MFTSSPAARLLTISGLCAAVSAELLLETLLTRSLTVSTVRTTLPECAQSCFTSASLNTTGCSDTDFSDCVCDSPMKPTLLAVWNCASSCHVNEGLTTEKVIRLACGSTVHDDALHLRSIYWTLYSVALISFGCRLLARSSKFGGLCWLDDWFIIASFLVLTGVTVGAEVMVVFGLGRDKWQLDQNQITIVLILFYVAEFAYVIESALTKTSIVVLYLRIFPSKRFRWACWGMLAFIGCFVVVFIVTLLTYCVPFSHVWQMWDGRHSGKCIHMTAQTYVCAVLNIAMDVTIFLMPIPKLLKLETDWKTKIGVILTFMLGLFVTICSVVRLTYLAGWADSTNPTYHYGALALWSLVELNAGVICACLPGMASLFRRARKAHTEKRARANASSSSFGNISHASRTSPKMFGNGMRSLGGKDAIVKTTQISVQYNARGSDGSSDEVELMAQSVPAGLRRSEDRTRPWARAEYVNVRHAAYSAERGENEALADERNAFWMDNKKT